MADATHRNGACLGRGGALANGHGVRRVGERALADRGGVKRVGSCALAHGGGVVLPVRSRAGLRVLADGCGVGVGEVRPGMAEGGGPEHIFDAFDGLCEVATA